MELNLANELWSELRRFVSSGDRSDAVYALITVLADQGYDANDIRSAFGGDAEVKRAVAEYFDQDAIEEDDEEEYEDFDQDY
jgi:hypothetical protein